MKTPPASFVNTIFRCPAPGASYPADANQLSMYKYGASYAYNAQVLRRDVPSWYSDSKILTKLSRISTPSKTWTFMDGWADKTNCEYVQGVPDSNWTDMALSNRRVNWFCHIDSANVVFLDSHIKSYKPWRNIFANP